MGAKIAATFTDQDKLKSNLMMRFYKTVDMAKLNCDDGFEYVVEFLEKELVESKIYDMVEAWNEFQFFKKKDAYKMREFCEEFIVRYMRAQSAGCGDILPYVRAFMLLNSSGLKGADRVNVLAKVEGPETEEEFF